MVHLTTVRKTLEASFAAVDIATAENIAARADIEDRIQQGMLIVRTLDAIVRNTYATNVDKLAAWLSASHVEKDPKKKKPSI